MCSVSELSCAQIYIKHICEIYIHVRVDRDVRPHFNGHMSDNDEIIRKRGQGLGRPLSIMVHPDYKSKYDKLSTERKVRIAEHLRRVIYPEIDRVWAAETGEPNGAA